MKKKLTIVIAMVLILSICIGPAALAANRASLYIDSTSATMTPLSNGKISIGFNITGTATMTEIGASIIEVKNSSGKTVKTYNFNDDGYEYMMGYNTFMHSGTVTFQGVVGQSYYAEVGFYAGNNTGGDADIFVTKSATAKR